EVFNGTIKVEDYKKPSKLDELKKEVKTDINNNIKAEAKDEVKEDIKEEVKDNIPPLDLSTGATNSVLEEYELTEEDKLNFADTRGINTISDSSEISNTSRDSINLNNTKEESSILKEYEVIDGRHKVEEAIVKNNKATITKAGLKELSDKLQLIRYSRNRLALDLSKFHMELELAQADKMDIASYKDLRKSVIHAIDFLCDVDRSPLEVDTALNDCLKCATFYERDSRTNIFNDLKNTVDIANRIKETIPKMRINNSVTNSLMNNDVFESNNISERTLSAKLESLAKENNIELDKNTLSEEDLNKSHSVLMGNAIVRKNIYNNIHKVYKVKFNPINDPDDMIKRSYTRNAFEYALDYMTTLYLTKVNNADAMDVNSYNTLNEINSDIKNGVMYKTAFDLAANNIFKAVAKSHPNNFYSAWSKALANADELNQKQTKFLEYYDNYFTSNKITSSLEAASTENTFNEISKIVVAQIITDPKNEKTRQAIGAGLLDINDVTSNVLSYLKDKEFKNVKCRTDLDLVIDSLNDKSLKEKVVKSVINKQKYKKPAKAANAKKIAEKKAHNSPSM
ncbi:MAG: hypothetical protein K5656_01905, partial [Lachnospiraceae bacterium]|nr:hypothetical protein [Lachnospiraceae bacterium]